MLRSTRLDWLPPMPLRAYLRPPARELPFPLEEPGCRHFLRPRQALWQGARALGLEPLDEILMPAYNHGSELQALLDNGLEPRFYEGTPALEPSEDELESCTGARTRALYLIHHIGFPQDAPRWRRWCDERGLLLIEDLALGWLAERDGLPAGSLGDLSIFGYYTMLGIPEGAAVLRRGGPSAATAPEPAELGWRAVARRQAGRIVLRAPGSAALRQRVMPEPVYDATADMQLGDRASGPTKASLFLLRRLRPGRVAERRRENYRTLLGGLRELVPAPFQELPPGASPLIFPIRCERKLEVLERLGAKGIRPLDIWSATHPRVPAARFPGATARRETVVGLPVHQELRPRDLERMIAAVAEVGG